MKLPLTDEVEGAAGVGTKAGVSRSFTSGVFAFLRFCRLDFSIFYEEEFRHVLDVIAKASAERSTPGELF